MVFLFVFKFQTLSLVILNINLPKWYTLKCKPSLCSPQRLSFAVFCQIGVTRMCLFVHGTSLWWSHFFCHFFVWGRGLISKFSSPEQLPTAVLIIKSLGQKIETSVAVQTKEKHFNAEQTKVYGGERIHWRTQIWCALHFSRSMLRTKRVLGVFSRRGQLALYHANIKAAKRRNRDS